MTQQCCQCTLCMIVAHLALSSQSSQMAWMACHKTVCKTQLVSLSGALICEQATTRPAKALCTMFVEHNMRSRAKR